jgi:hypothetical protein
VTRQRDSQEEGKSRPAAAVEALPNRGLAFATRARPMVSAANGAGNAMSAVVGDKTSAMSTSPHQQNGAAAAAAAATADAAPTAAQQVASMPPRRPARRMLPPPPLPPCTPYGGSQCARWSLRPIRRCRVGTVGGASASRGCRLLEPQGSGLAGPRPLCQPCGERGDPSCPSWSRAAAPPASLWPAAPPAGGGRQRE